MNALATKIFFVSILALGCLRPIVSPQLAEALGRLIYLVPDSRVFSEDYFFVRPKITLYGLDGKQAAFELNYSTARFLVFNERFHRQQFRLINFAVTRPHLLGQHLIDKVVKLTICKDDELMKRFELNKLSLLEIYFERHLNYGIPHPTYRVACNL